MFSKVECTSYLRRRNLLLEGLPSEPDFCYFATYSSIICSTTISNVVVSGKSALGLGFCGCDCHGDARGETWEVMACPGLCSMMLDA